MFSDSSLHFFLQTSLPVEQRRRMALLDSFQILSYNMSDFSADSGTHADKEDNWLLRLQRVDTKMLGELVC